MKAYAQLPLMAESKRSEVPSAGVLTPRGHGRAPGDDYHERMRLLVAERVTKPAPARLPIDTAYSDLIEAARIPAPPPSASRLLAAPMRLARFPALGATSAARAVSEKRPPAAAALVVARRGRRGPLPHQKALEVRFQCNLDMVEVYFGPYAVEACAMVNSEAFCVGNVIVFAVEAPSIEVVAHEVSHCLQQGGTQARVENAPQDLEVTHQGDAVEVAAAQQARQTSPSLPHEAVYPGRIELARLPSPPDCHTRKRGLSPVPDIVKDTYDGSASTSIANSWSMGSWQRRWQVYDSTDRLIFETTYTFPQPTLRLEKEIINAGAAGNGSAPWSVWHKVTETMVPMGGSDKENFPHDFVTFNVYESSSGQAKFAAEHARDNEEPGDDELRIIAGIPRPTAAGLVSPGGTNVSPEVALDILNNLSKGEPAFKPELGKGGCSWFVSEGTPYVGIDQSKNVPLEVEISRPADALVIDEAMLDALNAKVRGEFAAEFEAQYRSFKKLAPDQALNAKQRAGLARFVERAAESRMWDRVGKMVRESASKVGEVVLKASKYSRAGDGKFLVVADAAAIRVKGGMPAVVNALEKAGTPVDPVVNQAAEAMAKKLKWAGRVRSVFRYGGKVLIVVAIAQDVYEVYRAQDKTKAVITSLGGWAGASVGAAAFAELWTPADTAGPWAWLAHGVGTLVSGAIGYWVGSDTVRTVYEFVIED